MNYPTEESLSSAPTVAGGMRRPASFDEQSLSSAPTMVAGGPAGNSLGRIDQYELVRKLGGGGFGVVYLAKDTVSGIEVALKTLHPLLKHNAEEMDLLREKFALVARLSHPNIASPLVLHPIRDIMLSDESVRQELRLSPGDSIMVMRYAPGVTLSKWRRQFPGGIVPLEQVIDIGRQIASALDYAHSEHIVHRDIKPSNVMVETLPSEASQPSHSKASHGLRVRILDFGLAAEIRSSMSRVSSEQGDTSGTRPYMAPEQWLGRKQDGRTDQYALACVLYELLSGAPPFAGVFETGDPIIMRTAVERDAPEEIDGVSHIVNNALLEALSKNPKDRFATCSALAEALQNTTSLQPCLTTTPSNVAKRPAEPEITTAPSAAAAAEAALEADVLRRKFSLAQTLKSISEADRADKEFSKFISVVETELTAAEEAIRLDKFAAAGQCLDHADVSLDSIRMAKSERDAREKAACKVREEVKRAIQGNAKVAKNVSTHTMEETSVSIMIWRNLFFAFIFLWAWFFLFNSCIESLN